jgi:O-antigen ligase
MTLRTRGVIRLAFAALDLVVITFFVLTRSRTSMLAVLVAVAFSLAIITIRNQRQNLGRLLGTFVLIVGITGLAGLAVYSAPRGFNLLSVLHSERDEGDPTTLTGRVDLWKNVLEYAYERPVLGFGFGGFWSAKHIEAISAEQQWPINQAHSAYIDQVLAVGFPGAFLSVLVIFSGIVICTKRFFHYDNCYGVWAGLLVFITVHNLTEAISLSPGFLSFVLSLMSIQLALARPLPSFIHRYANEAELSRVLAHRQRP